MTAYWDTEDSEIRSHTASSNRNSERKGLGVHKHLAGPKSFDQIHQEMEDELGRPVSIGEVFIRTHTKPDGTYVDLKAQQVGETYEKMLQAKLAEVKAEASDCTSRPELLTTDDYNELFLQSTFTDERGRPYGIGSLRETHVKGKRKASVISSSFLTLQEQLKEAQQQIEKQASLNARLEEQLSRQSVEQQDKIAHLSLVEKYLRETDPRFLDFIATQPAQTTLPTANVTQTPPSTSQSPN